MENLEIDGSEIQRPPLSDDLVSEKESLHLHPNHENFKLLDKALDEIGPGPFQYKLLALTSFGLFVDAGETMILALLLVEIEQEWETTEQDLAIVVSFTALGMMIGALVFGIMSDKCGRKRTYELTLILCCLFGIISSFANNIYTFAILRLFLGLGYGGNVIAATTLLVEYSPSKVRGFYVAITTVMYSLGSIFIVGICWALLPLVGFRWMIRIASFIAIPVIIALICIPESIRYLVLTHQYEKAVVYLQTLARENSTECPSYFNVESLRSNLEKMQLKRMSLNDDRKYTPVTASLDEPQNQKECCDRDCVQSPVEPLLFEWHTLKTLIPLATMWFLNAFATSIFTWVPLEAEKSYNQSNIQIEFEVGMVIGFGFLGGTIASVFLTIYVYRLILLHVSPLVCGIFTIALGLLDSKAGSYAMLIFVTLGQSVLINQLYLYSPEVFPTSIRVTAFGICQLGHRLAPIVAPFVIASLNTISWSVVCFVFGSLYLLCGFVSFFLRTETYNKPLVEDGSESDDEIEENENGDTWEPLEPVGDQIVLQ
mmetsp:Transcript_13349/g.17392  ORF Transcript_13349/g.17392 Transcript_13349/m.17392 type:complete len:542 (+) Transcript_13349:138-1763(+)